MNYHVNFKLLTDLEVLPIAHYNLFLLFFKFVSMNKDFTPMFPGTTRLMVCLVLGGVWNVVWWLGGGGWWLGGGGWM